MEHRPTLARMLARPLASWRLSLGGPKRRPSRTPAVTVVFFGRSHVVCLMKAWQRGLYRTIDPTFDYKFILSDTKTLLVDTPAGRPTVHPSLAAEFDKLGVYSGATETWLVSVVRGNAFNQFGLLEPDPLFDFVHPSLPTLPVRPGAQVLPYDAIRSVMERSVDETRQFYSRLRRDHIAGVFHLEAPPPIPSLRQCYRGVDAKWLAKSMGRTQVKISPPEFRLKLWHCQAEVTEALCREHSVTHVRPPAETLDAGGYLVPEAWHGATHASPWYGAYALRKIEELIAARRRTT